MYWNFDPVWRIWFNMNRPNLHHFCPFFLTIWLKISKDKNNFDLFFYSWWPNKICRLRHCCPVHLFSKTVLVQNEKNIFELVPIISNWTKNYFLLLTFACSKSFDTVQNNLDLLNLWRTNSSRTGAYIDQTQVFIALSFNRSMKTRIKALECVKSATNAETKVNTTSDIQNTIREHA